MEKTVWEFEALDDQAHILPKRIWTRKPPILSSGIDPLQLLLLPAGPQSSQTSELNIDFKEIRKDECAGFWLGSPFFNIASFDHKQQITDKCWVSNFPPVNYQDKEFLEQLKDVGLGPDWEIRNLNLLHDAGYKTLYAVPAENALEYIPDVTLEACLLIVRTREELEAVRLGLVSKIKDAIQQDLPIALLGLHSRIPRNPEQHGIASLLKEPA